MKRKYLNRLSKLAIVAAVISITSCKEEGGMAPEYMPDMYRSPSVEPYVDYGELRGNYSDTMYTNKMTARKPVTGTIPRGFQPYGYENTTEGYELAGQNLKNPIIYSDKVGADGKELYGMFCVHCHGKTGQGDGTLVQRDKFPPIPTKFAEGLILPEGKMFHTITYGKGLMGSHASQLNKEERWKLVHYIRTSFLKEAALTNNSNEGGTTSAETGDISVSSIVAFTGDLGSDLDLIFDFFDEENPEYESLPSSSPAVVLKNVTFSRAGAKIKEEDSKKTLDLLAAKLIEKKNVKVQLNGHTHKGPSESVNMKLSKKRANSVKEYLVNKGVEADRISTKGFGHSQLLSEEEAEINRRTEITVIK